MICVITSRATAHQIDQMLKTLGSYIKLAVDIERGVLAGGGALHADCEAALVQALGITELHTHRPKINRVGVYAD